MDCHIHRGQFAAAIPKPKTAWNKCCAECTPNAIAVTIVRYTECTRRDWDADCLPCNCRNYTMFLTVVNPNFLAHPHLTGFPAVFTALEAALSTSGKRLLLLLQYVVVVSWSNYLTPFPIGRLLVFLVVSCSSQHCMDEWHYIRDNMAI